MLKKILLALAVLSMLLLGTAGFAQNPGVLRLMEKRAVEVSQMKNRFVAKVLDRYGIGYQADADGVITSINIDGASHSVIRVDIAPVFETQESDLNLLGHEIYFFTESGTLQLFTAMPAKR